MSLQQAKSLEVHSKETDTMSMSSRRKELLESGEANLGYAEAATKVLLT